MNNNGEEGYPTTIYFCTNCEITYIHLSNKYNKVITPYKNWNKIELRLTKEIFTKDSEYVFYVDVVAGKIILERQLFMC